LANWAGGWTLRVALADHRRSLILKAPIAPKIRTFRPGFLIFERLGIASIESRWFLSQTSAMGQPAIRLYYAA
jgi:hypothetical protein